MKKSIKKCKLINNKHTSNMGPCIKTSKKIKMNIWSKTFYFRYYGLSKKLSWLHKNKKKTKSQLIFDQRFLNCGVIQKCLTFPSMKNLSTYLFTSIIFFFGNFLQLVWIFCLFCFKKTISKL